MRFRVRGSSTIILAVSCLCLILASVAPSAAQAQACNTDDPPADVSSLTLSWTTDQQIQTNFSNARAAEGCNVSLVLPAGYDAMTPQQQMLWMFNNEREARGLPDLQLDTTLMGQIATNH